MLSITGARASRMAASSSVKPVRVSSARLHGRVLRRQRQGAVALVGGAGRSLQTVRATRGFEMAARTWSRQWWEKGGGGTPGTASPTTPSPISCSSVPATAHRGLREFARRAVATTCSPSVDRCARSEDRQVPPALSGHSERQLRLRQHPATRDCGPRHQRREEARRDAGVEEAGGFYVIEAAAGNACSRRVCSCRRRTG